MYQLYYSPGACSMAVHVVLNELNQPVELINTSISDGKNRSPEFLKLNPRGQIPLLVDDGFAIREGGAIISYLLDKHQSPMMPRSGKERAHALEWLMFANASMHPAYGKAFWINKSVTDPAAKEKLMKVACEQIEKLWQDVDAQLAKTPYVCGKDCSAADILLTVMANWAGWIPQPIALGANVKRMLKDVSNRPTYQKALKAEQVEYKAAA